MNPNEQITIIDYGMANLRSVQKAFEHVGAKAVITRDHHQIRTASKLVLPGVGAFRDAIGLIRQTGMDELISNHVRGERPFLGICLGMQMLFTKSYEDGEYAGLDLFPGEVVRFAEDLPLKVPHMGWNTLRFTKPGCPLFRGVPEESAVYFVHGYFAKPTEQKLVSAEADYPTPFCTAIWQGNTFATQFHPEKSQAVGLRMLKNFADL